MKRIIILHEHHCKRYIDISTQEQFEKVALQIIKNRFSGDNPYYPLDDDELEKPEPPFAKDDDKTIPAALKDAACKAVEEYIDRKREYDEAMKQRDMVKRCIKTNDGKLAIHILTRRKHYEDEGYDIEEVQDEYDPGE